MPSYGECRSTEIATTPQRCYDALTDFDSIPEWQGAVRSVDVLERDRGGRAAAEDPADAADPDRLGGGEGGHGPDTAESPAAFSSVFSGARS